MQHRNGTIRNELSSINLLQNKFVIDERKFWDILGYMASFLEKINYYNTENDHEGNWRELIESDPIIYIVSIINDPLDKLKELNGATNFKLETTETKIQIVNMLLADFNKVSRWYQVLNDMGEFILANKVGNILNDLLGYEKKQLEAFLKQNQPAAPTQALLETPLPPGIDAPTAQSGNVTDLELTKAVNLFFKGIFHIQNSAKNYLIQTIQKRRGHEAHTSLYIVFTLLFERLSKQINSHSKNHLDFYYKSILQQKLSGGRESSAIVSFKLLPGVSNFLLKSGAALSAGKINNSKEELVFKTQKPLLIQALEIEGLQTLFFNKNPYIKSGTSNPLISSVSHFHLVTNGKRVTSNTNNYLFGANEEATLKTQINPETAGAMGFVISSSVLDLQEGQRTINLVIKLKNPETPNNLVTLLNEIKEDRKKKQNAQSQSIQVIFAEIFEQAFNISYTSIKTWVHFEHYLIDFNEDTCEISIELLIPTSFPAVAVPKKNPENFNWPALKFQLNEFTPIYAYSFLKDVEIDAIDIQVTVNNMKNLAVYNNVGKMSLSKTFDLFGPIPTYGSYIMIGKSEIYKKNVSELDVVFEWNSLPLDYGGFETYYENYGQDINNDSFKVTFTMLTNGNWIPYEEKDREERVLFETEDCITDAGEPSVILKKKTSLSFTGIDNLGLDFAPDLKEPLLYNINTNEGFLKLTLTDPNFAFGQELYQQEFTEIARYNANNKTNLPYPNKPFVPKVNRILLSYKASDTLTFNAAIADLDGNHTPRHSFHHISPFGWKKIALNETDNQLSLLPSYEGEGYLLLTLKGIKNAGLVALYFDLETSSTQNKVKEDAIKFEYFELGDWKKLPPNNIMQDDTSGLIKSGIMEILLPNLMDESPEVLYRLRIMAVENAASYPKLKGIYLNAAQVKSDTSSPALKGVKIPAGTIKKMVNKFPAIQKITQPIASFDGHLPETETAFYTRISERLRHKARAVSSWDYERLILERFEEVKAVKCTNLDQSSHPRPGHVKVIVIAEDWTPDHYSFFNKSMLSRMEDYLKTLTSANVNLEVINPKIEYLIVRGIIDFMPGDQGGYYDQKINEDINTFLSPVYSLKDSYEGIGGVVVPNTVVGFIEDLPYVKSVKKLAIEHIIQNDVDSFSLGIFNKGQEIEPSTPWSVLVPFTMHHLESSDNINNHIDITNPGIGTLEIGSDFILGKPYHELAKTEDENSKDNSSSDESKPENAILVCKTKKKKDG